MKGGDVFYHLLFSCHFSVFFFSLFCRIVACLPNLYFAHSCNRWMQYDFSIFLFHNLYIANNYLFILYIHVSCNRNFVQSESNIIWLNRSHSLTQSIDLIKSSRFLKLLKFQSEKIEIGHSNLLATCCLSVCL